MTPEVYLGAGGCFTASTWADDFGSPSVDCSGHAWSRRSPLEPHPVPAVQRNGPWGTLVGNPPGFRNRRLITFTSWVNYRPSESAAVKQAAPSSVTNKRQRAVRLVGEPKW